MPMLEKLEELIYHGFKETDERLAQHRQETDALLARHRQEIDTRINRDWKEIKEQWRETDKRIERMHQKFAEDLNGVTDSLSRFSEQTVFPAAKRLFRERGVRLNLFYSNVEAHLDGDNMETDIIGLGSKCAVLL